MSALASAIYVGHVVHRRVRPVRHSLRYSLPMLLIDLDELPELARSVPGFSHNRFNLFSFHDRDHLSGGGEPVRRQIDRELSAAGFGPAGAIRVLCMPRVLGICFNPLSVFFCHARDGALAALLYEVNNTFGERHSYLVPAGAGAGGMFRQSCVKRFYVSPFMEMDMQYHFRVVPPADRAFISVEAKKEQEPVLSAFFKGKRRPLTGGGLLRLFLRYPLLAPQVLAGIHWEGLRLWLKGLRVLPRPRPPAEPVSHSPIRKLP